VFNSFAARDDVKKRIAELEDRPSSLREELQGAKGAVESTKAQRILPESRSWSARDSTRSLSTTKSPSSRQRCIAGNVARPPPNEPKPRAGRNQRGVRPWATRGRELRTLIERRTELICQRQPN
jgi:hypothetical protein